MQEIGLPAEAEAAHDCLRWLRLTHPDEEIVAAIREEITNNMKEGPLAVDRIRYARAFSIDFDPVPLERYLAQRKHLGGLDSRELVADLFLAEHTKAPRELAEFLEGEEGSGCAFVCTDGDARRSAGRRSPAH
jgi:hypothetical protein